jgi:hypothetical protein
MVNLSWEMPTRVRKLLSETSREATHNAGRNERAEESKALPLRYAHAVSLTVREMRRGGQIKPFDSR